MQDINMYNVFRQEIFIW